MVGHHNKELQSYYYDMLPYSNDGINFNTGLYTSRPNLKAAIRYGSKVMHAANKLYISETVGLNVHKEAASAYLRTSQMLQETLASAISSDVITGTSRSGIVDSTIDRIQLLIEENMSRMSTIIDDATF
jgi:hypothetical protein